MDRRAFLQASAAATGFFAGCAGGGGGSQDTATETTAATATPPPKTVSGEVDASIDIRNFSFLPQTVEIDPGGRVAWRNKQVIEHAVVSASFHDSAADWEFDTGPLGNGDAVAHTFEEAGVYEFYCSAHGKDQNCGAVLVGDVELTETLPCNKGAGST